MKQLLLFIALMSSVTITSGQNYLRYYELTDSAFYYWKISENSKADSMYTAAFDNFIGFPEDYANAAYNIWNMNPKKGKQYIGKSFQYGGFIEDIEYFLPKNGIDISKKELRKIKKNNPYNFTCKSCEQKIMRMGKRDLWGRFLFHWRINKVDRQNKEKLILFATEDTMMLNRFHTGIKANMYFSPKLKKQVAIPTDPEKSITEINKLREALFLTPLELYKKSHPQKLFH